MSYYVLGFGKILYFCMLKAKGKPRLWILITKVNKQNNAKIKNEIRC